MGYNKHRDREKSAKYEANIYNFNLNNLFVNIYIYGTLNVVHYSSKII
jgi:hypothetical protein